MIQLGQRAQRLGEGFALRRVGERRCPAKDPEQLRHLPLAQIDDVTVDFVRSPAAGHEFHQGAPALGDRAGDIRPARNAGAGKPLFRRDGYGAPLVLELLDGGQKAHFLGGLLLDGQGRGARQRARSASSVVARVRATSIS